MDRRGITDQWKWALPFAVLAVILLTFSMYQWVVPRTDLEVRSVYHESPGGGGTGGSISVNVLLTNKGNRDVEDIECNVRVLDKNMNIMAFKKVEDLFLQGRDNAEMKLLFIGSQYVDYTITIQIEFRSVGRDYIEDLEYSTFEDAMNIVFVDNLP